MAADEAHERERQDSRAVVVATGARLEVEDAGSGEPIVLIQTALVEDELVPLARRLHDRFRTIVHHRRGYGGSSPAEPGGGSVARDAADVRALLGQLGLPRAHVVGLSYSAAVALQLAADSGDLVHTLTLIEPPPVLVPSRSEFVTANERLLSARRARGPEAALEEFLSMLLGDDWRLEMERHLPGSAEQAVRGAATFFDVDLPALLTWQFTGADARAIRCPVLHVGGTRSGPWFAEVRRLVLEWFPHATDAVVDDADHSLAMTHPDAVAAHVRAFLRGHPMPPAGTGS